MLINSIIRYFNGTIKFRVTNGFGERLINLSSENNINLWEIDRLSDGFIAIVAAREFKYVVELAQRCNVDVKVMSKNGILFQLLKYRRRVGIFLGLILSITFLIVTQNIVWEIEVVGNQKVSSKTILTELKKLGIEQYTLITSIDFQNIKQEALLNLPQLSWLTINREGCKLTVQVSERNIAPELEESYPCDIVASSTGLILYMEVYAGEPLVEVNHTVREGQKLVSGVLESERLDIVTKVHANAKIIAQVQFDKTLGIDINHLSKEYTQIKTYKYITFFDAIQIPLFIASKQNELYDVASCHEYFELFTMKLPIGLKTSTYSYYNEVEEELTSDMAIAVLQESFYEYEQTQLKDFAILDRKFTSWQENDVLYVKIDYIAEENIVKKVAVVDEIV